MPEVGYIVVCEEVYTGKDHSETIIKKPLTAITPYSVPGMFSFMLAFSLYDLNDGPHKVEVFFKTPNEEIILNQVLDFEFEAGSDDKFKDVTLNLKYNNTVFKQTGMHKVEVILNDKYKNRLLIPVLPLGE